MRRRGIILGKVATIFCEVGGGIGSRVFRDALMTSYGWLKLVLKNLVFRGGWVKSSGLQGYGSEEQKQLLSRGYFGVVVAWRGHMVLLNDESIGI